MHSIRRIAILCSAFLSIAAVAAPAQAGNGWGWGNDKDKGKDKGGHDGGKGGHDGGHRLGAPEIDPAGIAAMATIVIGGVALVASRKTPSLPKK